MPYKILGKSLSEWIEASLADMESLAKDSTIDFHMGGWVRISKSSAEAPEVCILCLGGCLLYSGQIKPATRESCSESVDFRRRNLGIMPTDNYSFSVFDLLWGFGEDETLILSFINYVRMGNTYTPAIRRACLGSETDVTTTEDVTLYKKARKVLNSRGFIFVERVSYTSRSTRPVLMSPDLLPTLPEGADRKASYVAHVKETIQPFISTLKELGL